MLDRTRARDGSATATAERSAPAVRVRPSKPYPDFPLFPHATRRWAKKIHGRFVFFGPWEDPYGALERYLAQRDELMAGPRRFDDPGSRRPFYDPETQLPMDCTGMCDAMSSWYGMLCSGLEPFNPKAAAACQAKNLVAHMDCLTCCGPDSHSTISQAGARMRGCRDRYDQDMHEFF